MTEGLQKGDFMALGGVEAETAARYSGTAKSNAQAAQKNTAGSFAEKLWYGRKEANGSATSQAADHRNRVKGQQNLSGAGVLADRADQTAAAHADAAQQTTAKTDPSAASQTDKDQSADTGKEADNIMDYSEFFQEKINEIFVKVLNGDTEPSYQIGSRSFTEKDWKKFLKKFDSVQDAVRKLMREEHAKRAAKKLQSRQTFMARQKKTSVTDQSSLLFTDSTSCEYPSTDETKEDVRYVTWYTREGIFCRKMGQTEDEWSLTFKDPEQYDKVMELIGQFPSDWNLRFAAHENFWNDFLNGDIDTERFVEFMKGTNKGVPNYTDTRDGFTYIDTDQIQWAKYLNSFGNKLYTSEEFQKKWELEIAANAVNKIRILSPYDTDDSIYTSGRLYCEYPGGPLYTAAEMAKHMWEDWLLTENERRIL